MIEERREQIIQEAKDGTDGHLLQMVGWLSRHIVSLEMEIEFLRGVPVHD